MLKKIIQWYVTIVQKVLITVMLFMLYILGFGITFVFAVIFNRKLLGLEKISKDTFWKDAQGYDVDIDECMRES